MDAIDLLHLNNRHHSGMALRSLGCIDDYSAMHGCWEGSDEDEDDGSSGSDYGVNSSFDGPAGSTGATSGTGGVGGSGGDLGAPDEGPAGVGAAAAAGGGQSGWGGMADRDQRGGAQDPETGPNDVAGGGGGAGGGSGFGGDPAMGPDGFSKHGGYSGFDQGPGGNPAMGFDGFSEHGGYGGFDQGYGAPGGPGFGGPMAPDVGWGSYSIHAPKGPGALGVLDGIGIAANPITGVLGAGVKMATGYSPLGWAGIGARSLADGLGIGPKDEGTMSGQPEGPEGENQDDYNSDYGGDNPNSDEGDDYGPGPINPAKILPALRSPLQEELLTRGRTTRFTGGPQGPWSGTLYDVPQPSLQRSLMRG